VRPGCDDLPVGEHVPAWLFYVFAAIVGPALIAYGALGGGGSKVIVVGSFVLIGAVFVAVLDRW
jgi:hypothetical protein